VPYMVLNFNPRPCVRGDYVLSWPGESAKFQSTPLRKGRRHR